MKFLGIAVLSLLSSVAPAAPENDAASAALDAWHQAASRSDLKAYIDQGMTEDGVFLGTDPTERWDRAAFRAYAEPHFAKNHGWTLKTLRRTMTVSGTTAWFDEDLESKEMGPCRGTGVLAKAGGKWKVAQYNLSVPIPNDDYDAVKKLIRERSKKRN